MNVLKKIILSFLLIFFLISLSRNLMEYRNNLSFHQSFKNEYEKEKKTNLSLKTEILKKSDAHEVEKVIRNKLNLARQNELTVIIKEPTPTPKIEPTLIPPPYEQWIDVFFKN